VIDAENPEEWGQWAGVVSEVLFKGGRLDPVLFRDPELKKRFVLMAGYVEGVPVATCLLYLGGNGDLAESGDLGGSTGLGGSAGMYIIATLPSSQGRGFGRQLVEQAQAEAAERGYGFVVLHSTKAGFDFYSRLGYGTFGKLVLYYSISFR
jgi:ribosomal protein S18 acetylase RimI-like enzyme